MNKLIKFPEKQRIAIELMALDPSRTHQEIASEVGVTPATVGVWRKDAHFCEAIYNRYMQIFGGELPSVLNAMIREAKEGNVQAARLVLEHSGKLVKKIAIKVESPFEKFLNIDNAEIVDIEDDEIVEAIKSVEINERELPGRNEESQVVRVRREQKKISEITEKKKYNKMYHLRRRAKAVGLEPLPPGRPSKGKRNEWLREIQRREEIMGATGYPLSQYRESEGEDHQ